MKNKWVKFPFPKTKEWKAPKWWTGRKRWNPLKYGQFLVSILDFWGLPTDKIQRKLEVVSCFYPPWDIFWNWMELEEEISSRSPFFGASPFCLQSFFCSWWLQPMWKILFCQNGNLPRPRGENKKIFETTRWAPASYKLSYNPYKYPIKWPYKMVNCSYITLVKGVKKKQL